MPEGFHERVLVEETQILMEELAKRNSVVISDGSLTESLAKASDEEEVPFSFSSRIFSGVGAVRRGRMPQPNSNCQ